MFSGVADARVQICKRRKNGKCARVWLAPLWRCYIIRWVVCCVCMFHVCSRRWQKQGKVCSLETSPPQVETVREREAYKARKKQRWRVRDRIHHKTPPKGNRNGVICWRSNGTVRVIRLPTLHCCVFLCVSLPTLSDG